MTNRNSSEFTKEKKSRKRLDKISKLSYFGGKRKKKRDLGTITQCCMRDTKENTFFGLVQPIHARIGEDGGIEFQGDTYCGGESFRHNVQEKFRTKLPPTKATKSHRSLYSFFEECNIDRKTTNFLLGQRRIFINDIKVRWKWGSKLVVNKGDVVRV